MKELILKTVLEGLGLGALLFLVCAVGIRKGAVGMVHLYSQEVQDRCVKLGLTTHERIKRNALLFKLICLPGYIAYVLLCVYALNRRPQALHNRKRQMQKMALRHGRYDSDLCRAVGYHDDIHSLSGGNL